MLRTTKQRRNNFLYIKPHRILALAALVASYAPAAMITSTGSDIFTASATYNVHIVGNGNENANSAFVGNTGTPNLLTVNSTETFDVLYSGLPFDAIITSVTLDLNLSGVASGITGQTGTGGYLPSLSSTTTALNFNTVAVTLGLNTVTFSVPNNAVPFTVVLPSSFYEGLLANEDLQIEWQANTNFTRAAGSASGKYGTGQKQLAFSLSKTYTASAGLTINYDEAAPPPEPSAVPEPATSAVMGFGLIGLAFWRRRSNR
jgi:hypothetical protein